MQWQIKYLNWKFHNNLILILKVGGVKIFNQAACNLLRYTSVEIKSDL